MKLLLTSHGMKNKTIKNALVSLVRKTPAATKIAYIPIASNVQPGSKDWLLRQFSYLQEYGYSYIDIVDPTIPEVKWQNRLEEVDVIFVGGGNTFYLLDQVRKTGFDVWLRKAMRTKVYMGASAGSILMTPTIDVAALPPSDDNFPGLENLHAMNIVNFEIEPHCTGNRFSTVEYYAQSRNNAVYAIDDQTAIKIDGKSIEVVSEGKWELYD